MKTFFDYSLKTHNSFGIESIAKVFVVIESIEDIKPAIESFGKPKYILGWWSNIVLPSILDDIVWHPQLLYKNHKQHEHNILLTIWAGENWHNTVLYTIENWRWGIENLIAIPWNIWASPVQNIGEYWVELQDVFVQCTVFNTETATIEILNKQDCHFWYRYSIFKEKPWKYIVLDVTLQLTTKRNPILTYKPISDHFTTAWISDPTQKEIATTIEEIRWSKLPKPSELGNCWSFFQNPIVSRAKVDELLSTYPQIPHYVMSDWNFKLSAAWLIDTTGLKWYKQGNIGTYDKQPLVIVQYWNGTKDEIVSFSWDIIDKVHTQCWVTLQREVNIR